MVSIPVAFLAGVVTFLAPCFLSIIPVFVVSSYGSGRKRQALISGLFFLSGFLLVFFAFGLAASSFGVLFGPWRVQIQRLGGVFLILLGLYSLGIFKSPVFYEQFKFNVDAAVGKGGKLIAFLVGVTFGFSWTPCIGPTLALILFWTSVQATFVKGFLLLLVFSMGIVIPFIILSLVIDRFNYSLLKLKMVGYLVNKAFAVVTIGVGILLFLDKLGLLIAYTLKFQ